MDNTLEIIRYAIKNKVTLNVASADLHGNRNRIFNQISRIKKKRKKGKEIEGYDEYIKLTKEYDSLCSDGSISSKSITTSRTEKNLNKDNFTRVVKVEGNNIQVDEVKLSALDSDGKMMSIEEYCQFYNLPRKDIRSWKLITHTGVPYYNIAFKEVVEELEEINFDFIEELVQKHIKPIQVKDKSYLEDDFDSFDRLVMSDIHIGMNPNSDGFELYDLKWDEEELMSRLNQVVKIIVNNQKSDVLTIDELGDYLDGWSGQTTRGGHGLPQNMDNQKSFDVAVNFKIKLIDELVNYYDSITLNNVCEDNHSGAFGYVVNSAVKSILELKYVNVKVNNLRKFMSHYYIGKHCFILTHGKDSKHMKFGFKPKLDLKDSERIDQYCKQNNIYRNAEFIELSKGDSHQALFDCATSDDYDYFSYPAFSPSSGWVQTNFKVGRSGFVFGNIEYENNVKSMTPYWFKNKKSK